MGVYSARSFSNCEYEEVPIRTFSCIEKCFPRHASLLIRSSSFTQFCRLLPRVTRQSLQRLLVASCLSPVSSRESSGPLASSWARRTQVEFKRKCNSSYHVEVMVCYLRCESLTRQFGPQDAGWCKLLLLPEVSPAFCAQCQDIAHYRVWGLCCASFKIATGV